MTNVNTLADLRAYNVTGLTDEFVINLLGHSAIGDEGFGQWKVTPTSVAQRADDNGTFVHLAASNWYGERLYTGRATPEMFGAKRDVKYLRDCHMAASSHVLKSDSYSFVTADIGKACVVKTAGPSITGGRNYPILRNIAGLTAGDGGRMAAVLDGTPATNTTGVTTNEGGAEAAFGTLDDQARDDAISSGLPLAFRGPYLFGSTFNTLIGGANSSHDYAGVGEDGKCNMYFAIPHFETFDHPCLHTAAWEEANPLFRPFRLEHFRIYCMDTGGPGWHNDRMCNARIGGLHILDAWSFGRYCAPTTRWLQNNRYDDLTIDNSGLSGECYRVYVPGTHITPQTQINTNIQGYGDNPGAHIANPVTGWASLGSAIMAIVQTDDGDIAWQYYGGNTYFDRSRAVALNRSGGGYAADNNKFGVALLDGRVNHALFGSAVGSATNQIHGWTFEYLQTDDIVPGGDGDNQLGSFVIESETNAISCYDWNVHLLMGAGFNHPFGTNLMSSPNSGSMFTSATSPIKYVPFYAPGVFSRSETRRKTRDSITSDFDARAFSTMTRGSYDAQLSLARPGPGDYTGDIDITLPNFTDPTNDFQTGFIFYKLMMSYVDGVQSSSGGYIGDAPNAQVYDALVGVQSRYTGPLIIKVPQTLLNDGVYFTINNLKLHQSAGVLRINYTLGHNWGGGGTGAQPMNVSLVALSGKLAGAFLE